LPVEHSGSIGLLPHGRHSRCSRQSHTLLSVAAAEYKQLTQRVLAELADGNGQPFMDALTNGARALVADRRGRPGDHRRADAPAVSPVRQHQYKARAHASPPKTTSRSSRHAARRRPSQASRTTRPTATSSSSQMERRESSPSTSTPTSSTRSLTRRPAPSFAPVAVPPEVQRSELRATSCRSGARVHKRLVGHPAKRLAHRAVAQANDRPTAGKRVGRQL
jgi:hypothetical protein